MNTKLKVLLMDDYDQSIIVRALNELRNEQIRSDKPTDALDELILKTAYAQSKKVKVRGDCYERG